MVAHGRMLPGVEQGGLTMRGAYAIVAAVALVIAVAGAGWYLIDRHRQADTDQREVGRYLEMIEESCRDRHGEVDMACYYSWFTKD